MQRFNNIFLVSSGGPVQKAAFDRALFLARNNDGLLAVAAVTDAAEHGAGEAPPNPMGPFGSAGLRVSAVAIRDTSHVEIIGQVLRGGHDLVVITAKEQCGDRPGSGLANTARQLLRRCPCAVWFVRRERVPSERVLAAVNAAAEDPASRALNVKILRAAGSLAALDGSELHVVHAWRLFGEHTLRYRAGIPKSILRATLRERRAEHECRLAALSARIPTHHPHKIHLVKGKPEDVIVKLVQRERIDVVVMGSFGRSGIAGWLVGCTAERVIERVDCSVLLVKPDDFGRPVRMAEGSTWRQTGG